MIRIICSALCAMALTACATTNEVALAPNVVRLDTQAQGLAFVGSAGEVTLQRAAQATIDRGYTHFRVTDAQTAQGRALAGVNNSWSGSGTATRIGNTTYVNARGGGFGTPVYALTANVGMTVEMFHANEAGARGAFNAQEVLANKGRM